MKRRGVKRLQLARETVQRLEAGDLGNARGGDYTDPRTCMTDCGLICPALSDQPSCPNICGN